MLSGEWKFSAALFQEQAVLWQNDLRIPNNGAIPLVTTLIVTEWSTCLAVSLPRAL